VEVNVCWPASAGTVEKAMLNEAARAEASAAACTRRAKPALDMYVSTSR
jgi:hypothetical protein